MFIAFCMRTLSMLIALINVYTFKVLTRLVDFSYPRHLTVDMIWYINIGVFWGYSCSSFSVLTYYKGFAWQHSLDWPQHSTMEKSEELSEEEGTLVKEFFLNKSRFHHQFKHYWEVKSFFKAWMKTQTVLLRTSWCKTPVSLSTVSWVLHCHGLKGSPLEKKSPLHNQHLELKFAADHIDKEK